MATRNEHTLMRRAKLKGTALTYGQIDLPNQVPPASAWLRLLMADTDKDLVACAGLFGPIGGKDALEDWCAIRAELWKLITAYVGTYVEPDDVFAYWTPTPSPGFAQEITRLIREGAIYISSVRPFTVAGNNGRGIALTQSINEMLSAKHLLWCKHCGRPFVHFSARATAFCGSACRKAAHLLKGGAHG